MSQRSYFERRTAIPGFTLILIVLAINYVPFSKILVGDSNQELWGLLFTVLTLLSGSAIGFLVAEASWWWFQGKGAQFADLNNSKKSRKPIATLIEKFNLNQRAKKNEDKQKILAVFGYVAHYELGVTDESVGKEKRSRSEVVEYTIRRWDLYHLFSAEMASLLIGLLMGWASRIIYVLCLGIPFSFPLQLCWNVIKTGEFWILAFTTIIGAILWCRMKKARKWVNTQYDYVSTAIIRNSSLEKEDLVNVFSPDFFDTSILDGIGKEKSEKLKAEDIYSVLDLTVLSDDQISKLLKKNRFDKDQITKWVEIAKDYKKNFDDYERITLTKLQTYQPSRR